MLDVASIVEIRGLYRLLSVVLSKELKHLYNLFFYFSFCAFYHKIPIKFVGSFHKSKGTAKTIPIERRTFKLM